MHLLRIFAVLAVAATGVWLGFSWEKGPGFDALAGLATTFGAYLLLEYQDRRLEERLDAAANSKPVLSMHDKGLGDRLCEVFSPRVQYFLREHSFGQPYHDDDFKPLMSMTYAWKGIDFEFDDGDLERLKLVVVTTNEELVSKLAVSSGLAENWPERHYSIPTDEERSRDHYEQHTWDAIQDVNALTKSLLEAYDAFRREFRQRSDIGIA